MESRLLVFGFCFFLRIQVFFLGENNLLNWASELAFLIFKIPDMIWIGYKPNDFLFYLSY